MDIFAIRTLPLSKLIETLPPIQLKYAKSITYDDLFISLARKNTDYELASAVYKDGQVFFIKGTTESILTPINYYNEEQKAYIPVFMVIHTHPLPPMDFIDDLIGLMRDEESPEIYLNSLNYDSVPSETDILYSRILYDFLVTPVFYIQNSKLYYSKYAVQYSQFSRTRKRGLPVGQTLSRAVKEQQEEYIYYEIPIRKTLVAEI